MEPTTTSLSAQMLRSAKLLKVKKEVDLATLSYQPNALIKRSTLAPNA
jgi:hypothetical protein